MIEDIKSDKDGVSYVLVFKLSRFGRNAADVLSSLQTMQDFGVNLICVEDGIDSSKDAGKLIISVLSAVAEIEKDNIRVQTLEGRMQKAREGRWVGGFAPYGYRLVNGALEINEDEAITSAEVIEKLLNLSKEMTDAYKAGEDKEPVLVEMAPELTERIRRSRTVDWDKKQSARAYMRTQVKHLLRKYKYPPEQAKGAIDTVIRQAELMSLNLTV